MKLSIITINYNNKDGLELTISSVLSQTFQDLQYIVIDGNSTDGSKDILKKYKNHIDIIISEPDTGIYNAMNKGAKYAKGEYLLFLNSGDNLYKENVLSILFSTNPTEDIVSCNLFVYSNKYKGIQIAPKNVSLYTFTGGSLPHPSTIIKNSIFQKIGGYHENYKIISDWCFFVDSLIVNNCSYSTRDLILTAFNCFGISSTHLETELLSQKKYLSENFPRVYSDYTLIEEEALSNTIFYISSKTNKYTKNIYMLPFKILNRVLKLRNKLSKRIGTLKL